MGRQRSQRSRRQTDADALPSAAQPVNTGFRPALVVMPANGWALADELGEAAQHFHAVQAVDGGRRGCMMALKAVIDFCDYMGLGQERRRPLLQLFVALESAENGAVDPLLGVASRPNAPPLTEAERRQRGCLAAAMEALIRGGSKADDAARWVANRSRKLTTAGRVKTDLWKAVKSWRVAAKGGDITRDRDAFAFRVACEAMDNGAPTGQQGAEAMLRMAEAEGTIQETPGLT